MWDTELKYEMFLNLEKLPLTMYSVRVWNISSQFASLEYFELLFREAVDIGIILKVCLS